MLTVSQNRGGIADVVKYYTSAREYSPEFLAKLAEENATVGYYATGAEVGHPKDQGYWGADAARFGYVGAITAEHMALALAGCDAAGKPQVQGAMTAGRKTGYDNTFSCVKTHSAAWASAQGQDKDALERAGRAGSDAANAWINRFTEVRYGKRGEEKAAASGIVAGCFMEGTNRNGEPDLHFQTVKMNFGWRADGKACTVDQAKSFSHAKAAGALGRAETAYQLTKLGYGLRQRVEKDPLGYENGNVFYEIAGYRDEDILSLSSRRKEVLDYAEEHKVSKQAACLATRQDKDRVPWDEMESKLTAMLQERGIAQTPETLKGRPHEMQRELSDAQLLAKLHERNAKFTDVDLMERIALERGWKGGAAFCLEETERVMRENHLQERGHNKEGQRLFCSQHYLDTETAFVRSCIDRKGDAAVRVPQATVRRAVAEHEARQTEAKGSVFELHTEQLAVVDFVCTNSGGTAVINGRPGAGKTATIGACVSAFQAQGRLVIGCSTSEAAATVLGRDTGLVCFNAKKLAARLTDPDDSKRLVLPNGAVVIFDESGMAGLEDIRTIQSALDDVGGKLVMQGDDGQLKAVSAGDPHRLAMNAVGFIDAGSIRRQRQSPDLLEVAYDLCKSAEEMPGAVVAAKMKEKGILQTVGKGDDIGPAVAEIAKRYTTTNEITYIDQSSGKATTVKLEAKDKLAIASVHTDRKALNSAIREELKTQGKLGPGLTLTHQDRSQKTQATGRKEIEICEGERLCFTQNNEGERNGLVSGKAVNGEYGTVSMVQDHHYNGKGKKINSPVVVVEMDDGQRVSFLPNSMRAFDYAYADTVHKDQGKTAKATWALTPPAIREGDSERMNRNSARVQNTRAELKHEMLGPEARNSAYGFTLDGDQAKGNALTDEETKALHAPTLMQRARERVQELVDSYRQESQRVAALAQQAPALEAATEQPTAQQRAPKQQPLTQAQEGAQRPPSSRGFGMGR